MCTNANARPVNWKGTKPNPDDNTTRISKIYNGGNKKEYGKLFSHIVE